MAKTDKNAFTQDIIKVLSETGFKTSLKQLAQTVNVSSDILEDAVSRVANSLNVNFLNIEKQTKKFEDKGISGFIAAGEKKMVVNLIQSRLEELFREELERKGSTNKNQEIRNYSIEAAKEAENVYNRIYTHAVNTQKVFDYMQKSVSRIFDPIERGIRRIPLVGDIVADSISHFEGKFIDKLMKSKMAQQMVNSSEVIGEKMANFAIIKPFTAGILGISALFAYHIVKDFTKLIKMTDEIASNLGLTFYQSLKYTRQIFLAYTQTAKFSGSLQEISQMFISLSDKLSTLNIPTKVITDLEKIRIGFGLTGEETVSLFESMIRYMGISIDNLKAQREIYVSIVYEAKRLNLSTQEMAKNIQNAKEASSLLLLNTQKQRREFVAQIAEAQKMGKTVDEAKNFFGQFDHILDGIKAANQLAISGTGVILNAQKLFNMGLEGDFVTRYRDIIKEIYSQYKKLENDQIQSQIFIRKTSLIFGKSADEMRKSIEDYGRSLRDAKQQSIDFEKSIQDINKTLGLDEKYNPFKQIWIDIKTIAMDLYKILYPLIVVVLEVLRWVVKSVDFLIKPLTWLGKSKEFDVNDLQDMKHKENDNFYEGSQNVKPKQNYYSDINQNIIQKQNDYSNIINKNNKELVESVNKLHGTIKNQNFTLELTQVNENKVNTKTVSREIVRDSRKMSIS